MLAWFDGLGCCCARLLFEAVCVDIVAEAIVLSRR